MPPIKRPVPPKSDAVYTCPACQADLHGAEKPESEREFGGDTHYYRVILVKGFKDNTCCWMCPDCDARWPALGAAVPDDLQAAIDADYNDSLKNPRSRLSPLADV
jgi:hypothetical protein